MANYVTLAEVKNYLKINSTEHDARLSNLITFGCSVIESYCGRTFSSATYTEVFDGGTSSIFVKNIPVNNVHQVLEFDGTSYQFLEGPTPDGSIIDRGGVSKSISSFNNFILSNRYYKFGTTAGKFDGTSSYLSTADSDDFWFDTSSFAIEGYFRFDNYTSNQVLVSQVQDSNNYWRFYYDHLLGIRFECVSGSVIIANVCHGANTDYSANQFVHYAVSRDNSNICRIFRNGNRLGNEVTISNTIPNFSASLEVGRQNLTQTNYFNGYMDELRISLSEPRFTANFTPQSYSYSPDNYSVLLLHFNGAKNATSTSDSSKAREQYAWYPETGEFTKNVGEDTGRETLSILGVKKYFNYARGLKITYNGGYDTVPSDLKLATLDYVKELHKGIESRGVSLQGESMTAFEFTGGFAPHIRRVLDLYRIVM